MAGKSPRASDRSARPWSVIAHAAEDAPIGLILAGNDGAVLAANHEALRLLKRARNDIVGQPVASLFDSEDGVIRNAMAGSIERAETCRQRLIVRRSDGVSVDCDLAVHPVPNGGSEPLHAVWLNDISEHAAIQRSLIQAERLSAFGEVVAGVAHELNNPLTGILGYAQLMLNDDLEPASRQRLEHIVSEAMRCQAVVESLRGFSSRATAERALHDVNRVVDGMVTLLEYQMRIDGIKVIREFSEDIPLVFVDAHELGRAILNIVHNAQQALGTIDNRERTFSVATESNDNEVLVRFRDNGPGIPSEFASRIFDPFFTTQEFGKGVGLGLSVAYGIVREHGGRIDVDSKPGHGAEFVVRLPQSGGGD